MTSKNKLLSPKQYILYIVTTQIGIGVLTLPRELTKVVGSDGWISIILGWALILVISYTIIQTMKRYPEGTLYDLLPLVFGKWLGKLFALCWVMYTYFAAGITLFNIVFIIQVWILVNTSNAYLVVALLIPVYLVASKRLQVQGRYAEFSFLSTIWLMPLLLFAYKDSHWLNLLPLFKDGLIPVVTAVHYTVLPFLGFELAFFLYPYLVDKKSAFQHLVVANTMTMLFYVFLAITSIVYFSEPELKEYYSPTLQLLKTVILPFIERFEIIFLAFYLILLSQTVIPYLYTSSVGAAHVLGLKTNTGVLKAGVLIFIIISWFVEPSFKQIEQINTWFSRPASIFCIAFPVLLWLYISFVKRPRKEQLHA